MSSQKHRLLWNEEDPFPLLPGDSHSYADAQRHSAQVDLWLGLRTEAIESHLLAELEARKIASSHQLWIGLPVRSLLTPYTELRLMLHRLDPKPGTHIVDLGAGYGRMGFVIGKHYPEVRFTGYEFVESRVVESNRCLLLKKYPLVQMIVADLSLSTFSPVAAQYYFIYDFGKKDAIEKTLNDLKTIAKKNPIVAIGRGRASRDIIEQQHPWLSQVVEPSHFRNYSIYRSSHTS